MTRGRATGDRGSGSVLVLALSGVLLTVLLAGVVLAGVVQARHRAESAADLAALAGAAALQSGSGAGGACSRAVQVGARDGASVGCRVEGAEVVVDASVSLPPAARAIAGVATARSRAGPSR